MHLSEKPIDYTKTEEFIDDVNNLSLESARQLVKKLYQDNRHFKHVAARAAVTIDQYKHLLTVFDGYVADKENVSEKGYSLKKMIVNVLEASKHLAFWVIMLSEAASNIVYEDNNVTQQIFTSAKDVCHNVCSTTYKINPHQILLPDEMNGICVQNLERTEEENSGNSEKGFYSRQSSFINRGNDNTSRFQKGDAKWHHKPGRSTLDDRNSLQDDAKSDDEPSSTTLKESESLCENYTIEGGNDRSANQVTSDRFEKRKKTFGISYLKSQNLFKSDVIRGKKVYPNISITCNEGSRSTSLYQPTGSENLLNKDDQSSSANENDINEDTDSFPKADVTSSKGPSRYKRRHSLYTHKSNVYEKSKSKIDTSENDTPVSKRPRKYRRKHSDIPENDSNMDIDESETALQNSAGMSKRLHRSRKQNFLNTHESEFVEHSPSTSGKTFMKCSSFLTSETEAEEVVSVVKPKRGRRGRRKKVNMVQEREKNILEKDESVSFDNVPHASSSKCEKKQAYVVLTDVLDDPEAQQYLAVIQCKERKGNESANSARCKEKNEIEEAASKERNEREALQEWNVVDAVSDEDDEESDNMEGIEELSNNNNDDVQTSDPEQEHMVNDDGKQLEVDDSEKEDYDSNIKFGESCSSKHDDKNYSSSDSEIKGPSTPDIFPDESDPEDNSDAQDENDDDADSDRSNEDEDMKKDIPSRSRISSSPKYGKAGPRTPPHPHFGPRTPPDYSPLRRGPKTPPGSGPESEGSKQGESSMPQSDKDEDLTVVDEEECHVSSSSEHSSD